MLQHRVVVGADLVFHPDAERLGLNALELNAVVELVDLHALQHPEEIEMPPGAAVLAVGRELEPDLLLLADDLLYLAIFDLLELGGRDRAALALGARVLDGGRAQDAADMVGAERRLGSGHRVVSSRRPRRPAGLCCEGFLRRGSIFPSSAKRA